ncbi:MAG: hypothetical protein ACRDV6_09125, partial [Acidimicrobiales bacterium]
MTEQDHAPVPLPPAPGASLSAPVGDPGRPERTTPDPSPATEGPAGADVPPVSAGPPEGLSDEPTVPA